MTKLKIKVTKDVLAKTANCSGQYSSNCAVAYAIRDIFPFAQVYEGCIEVWNDHDMSFNSRLIGIIDLPSEATNFIEKFDKFMGPDQIEERKAMSELDFEIEIPDKVINMISIEDIKKLIDHPTLELV